MVIMYKHAKVYCPVALHRKHNISIHELTIKRDSNLLHEVEFRSLITCQNLSALLRKPVKHRENINKPSRIH